MKTIFNDNKQQVQESACTPETDLKCVPEWWGHEIHLSQLQGTVEGA